MSGGDPRHVDLGTAGGARTNGVDRTARQARTDRLGQWDRVHVERHARLGAGELHHLALHRAGQPMQNGFCESFNGRMRDELLNESLFFGLDHARTKISD
jgi:transposase InsO family protein